MNISSVSSTLANIAQESLETAAQTRAEAAKGDQQAVRRSAQVQARSAPAPVEVAAPGEDAATASILNVRA